MHFQIVVFIPTTADIYTQGKSNYFWNLFGQPIPEHYLNPPPSNTLVSTDIQTF